MFGIFKGQAEFKQFDRFLDMAQAAPRGSIEAIHACERALTLLQDAHKWPSGQQAYRDYYKGLLLMILGESNLMNAVDNKQIFSALEQWDSAYQLMRSNNFQDNWVQCAVYLGGEYSKYRDLSPHQFIERAIELTLACKQNLKGKRDSRINLAIVCGSLSEYYCERPMGDPDDNIEIALSEIREALSLVSLKTNPVDWAMFKSSEASLLSKYRRGDRIKNVSEALSGFEQADNILAGEPNFEDRSPNSGNWAMLLLDSPIGKREANIEKAIELIDAVSTHREVSGDKRRRSKTLINKSSIYLQRIRGDRYENLDAALQYASEAHDLFGELNDDYGQASCEVQMAQIRLDAHRLSPDLRLEELEEPLQSTLDYYRRELNYDGLIKVTNVLAQYYAVKSSGSYSENVNRSIALIREVLNSNDQLRESDRIFLEQNLANFLLDMPFDSGDENYREAVELYEKGLTYYEVSNDTDKLISARMNLATTLVSATRNSGIHDQERGITLLQQNLDENTVIDDPRKFAQMALNLGNAYCLRVAGHAEVNTEIALNYYSHAIDMCPPEKDFVTWAYASTNLAMELLNFKEGQTEEILELTLEKIEEVLAKTDTSSYPAISARAKLTKASILIDMVSASALAGRQEPVSYLEELCEELDNGQTKLEWAQAKRKLGQSYLQSKKSFPDYVDRVESVFSESLQVYNVTEHPNEFFQIKVILASMHADFEKWKVADDYYQEAFAVHQDKLSLTSDNLIAKSILSLGHWNTNMAPFCALMQGDVKRALAYNEMLRTRQILDQSRDRITAATEDVQKYRYENIRQIMEQSLGGFWGKERAAIMKEFNRLYPQSEVTSTIEQQTAAEEISDIDRILEKSHHWIFIPFLSNKSAQFVMIPPGKTAEYAVVSPLINMGLEDVLSVAMGPSNQDGADTFLAAIHELEKNGNAMPLSAEIEHIASFLTEFMGKWLIDTFFEVGAKFGDRVCVVPQWILGLLPFGLIKIDPVSDLTLGEAFELSYAQNISSIVAATKRAGLTTTHKRLGLVPGPKDKKLVSAVLELDLIASIALDGEVLARDLPRDRKAVREVLGKANYWHFATHGKFNWMQPMTSSLELADNSLLELHQMAYLLSDHPLRLVTLSACEAGIYDILDPTNDFNGLPSAFIRIGAAGVITTLWPVGDEASTVFMTYFYERLFKDKLTPAKALQMTRSWMRRASAGEIIMHLEAASDEGSNISLVDSSLYQELIGFAGDSRPFGHPIFWAAYVLYGV